MPAHGSAKFRRMGRFSTGRNTYVTASLAESVVRRLNGSAEAPRHALLRDSKIDEAMTFASRVSNSSPGPSPLALYLTGMNRARDAKKIRRSSHRAGSEPDQEARGGVPTRELTLSGTALGSLFEMVSKGRSSSEVGPAVREEKCQGPIASIADVRQDQFASLDRCCRRGLRRRRLIR